MEKFRSALAGFVLLLVLPSASRVEAQQPEIYFADVPVHVGTLDPVVRKNYLLQNLYYQYQYVPWEYTNYAKNHYNRYTRVELEGETWYDVFGSYITRGFGIYSWSQTQPQALAAMFSRGSSTAPGSTAWWSPVT